MFQMQLILVTGSSVARLPEHAFQHILKGAESPVVQSPVALPSTVDKFSGQRAAA